jgi:serine/threonine-protein kinase
MPFVEEESLRTRLKREGPLPLDTALRIAVDVGEALAYAHGRGVIHRDIKPGNILLSEGSAVVTDFGIAAALEQAPDEHLTRTGLSVGSVGYMSPECQRRFRSGQNRRSRIGHFRRHRV